VSAFLNKTMLLILLCLIFIGQSVAYTTSLYNMKNMASMASQHHKIVKDNTSHEQFIDCKKKSTIAMYCPTDPSEECCAQECECLTSGSSTVSAFLTAYNHSAIVKVSNKIAATHYLLASQVLTSLFRPPILS